MSSERCRLCDGETSQLFTKTILGKYDVGFHECKTCGSLQTDTPFWLEEAYADGIRVLDTGAAARAQILQRVCYLVAKLHHLSPSAKVLDWGSGDGLLTRMLRDVGLDAYHWDPYARNTYAAGFDADADAHYDMVTAFEVWEHLPEPAQQIGQIFSYQPQIHVATTGLYQQQGPDWPYLNTLTGRHVFFYSRNAVEMVAREHGYSVDVYQNDLLIFHRSSQLSRWRKVVQDLLLSNRRSRLFETLYALKPKYSLQHRDYDAMCKLLLRHQNKTEDMQA